MNNKKTKVTFCDLGEIIENLNTLEICSESSKEIQDLRIKLATIWLQQAKKMQRFKSLSSNSYRYYAVEEDRILAAINLFGSARQYLEKHS